MKLMADGTYRGTTWDGSMFLAMGYCGQPTGVGVSIGTWEPRDKEVRFHPLSENADLPFSFSEAFIKPAEHGLQLVAPGFAAPIGQ